MDRHRSLDRDLAIAEHFPPPTLDRWRRAAEESLSGRTVEALTSEALDDVVVKPLYRAADLPDPLAPPGLPGGRWTACQLVLDPDPAEAGHHISAAASLGADVAWIVLDPSLRTGGGPASATGGVLLTGPAAVGRLLEGRSGGPIRLVLDGGGAALPLAALYMVAAGTDSLRDLVAIHHDPLGSLAADGELPFDLDLAFDLVADLASFTVRTHPDLPTVAVSTLPYAAAGATPAQELALMLATGVEYLRALTGAGLDPAAAGRQLSFVLTVGRDLFIQQAKLRAARRLWRRVLEACGAPGSAGSMALHAVTSPRTMTVRDPFTNILRTTVQAFAAVTGGADALTVLPFDSAGGISSEEALRLAALTHAVLREEGFLDRVVDPAAGCYYVERLTDELAHAAWAGLQHLERAGGMASALLDGTVRRLLLDAAGHRRDRVARGLDPVIGVSSFPNLEEQLPSTHQPPPQAAPVRGAGSKPPEVELAGLRAAAATPGSGSMTAAAVAAFHAGATLAEVTAALAGERSPIRIDSLPRGRDGEPFEALRDDADRLARCHGTPPRAFIAALGPPAEHRATATLAANLLAAGGIAAPIGDGFDSPAEAADAFAASGLPVAVICASRKRRDEVVPLLARVLRERGARRVLVAGATGEPRREWREAGVDGILGKGGDLLGLLRDLLDLEEVPR